MILVNTELNPCGSPVVVVLWTGSLPGISTSHDGNPLREGMGWTAKRGIPKWNDSVKLLSPLKTKQHTWKVSSHAVYVICHFKNLAFQPKVLFFSVAVSKVKPFTF